VNVEAFAVLANKQARLSNADKPHAPVHQLNLVDVMVDTLFEFQCFVHCLLFRYLL